MAEVRDDWLRSIWTHEWLGSHCLITGCYCCGRYKAKHKVAEVASHVYERCVDTETGNQHFFNPRTGCTTWDKPFLLRDREICNPITVPEPDRYFSILCVVCNRTAAKRWCVDCGDHYCAHDFKVAHQKGSSVNHCSLPADLCVQCGIQVASRHCVRCDDDYCCTCFFSLHKRGQLHLHQAVSLSAMCGKCERWMAHKTCNTCQIHLCRICARASHEVSTRRTTQM